MFSRGKLMLQAALKKNAQNDGTEGINTLCFIQCMAFVMLRRWCRTCTAVDFVDNRLFYCQYTYTHCLTKIWHTQC